MNIRELREDSVKIANQAKDLLETITTENRAEKTAEFERMMVESDAKRDQAERLERAEKRANEFSGIATPVANDIVTVESRGTKDDYAKAFDSYLRGHISEREVRAQSHLKDTADHLAKGGVLVPETFSNRLITSLRTEGPMLDGNVVDFISTSGGAPISFPVSDDNERAIIIPENTEIPKDDITFRAKTVGAYKYTSKRIHVPTELLEDASIDVGSRIADILAKRIGRGVNEDLTIGSGNGMPEGIAKAARVGVTSASATGITFAELVALQHAVDAAYRGRGAYMLADNVVMAARQMVDGNGQFIWQPGATLDQPERILGKPFYVNSAMSGDFATGNKVALFGDFKAYTVRQARGITIRRLEEVAAVYDQVVYLALARFDGKLLDEAAVAALAVG